MFNLDEKTIKYIDKKIGDNFSSKEAEALEYYIIYRDELLEEVHSFIPKKYNITKEMIEYVLDLRIKKFNIGVCTICNDIIGGKTYNYKDIGIKRWAKGKIHIDAKICEECVEDIFYCSCCKDEYKLKDKPFIRSENRYSDICKNCYRSAKRYYPGISIVEVEEMVKNDTFKRPIIQKKKKK